MHPNFYLSPLAACLALTMASPVKAAEPVPLESTTLQNLQQQFDIALPGVKKSSAVLATDSLQFIQQHTDSNKISHVRMQQNYAGYVVFGGYAIMHSADSANNLLASKNNTRMNGVVYRGLEAELGKPSPDFVKNGGAALQHFQAQYSGKAVSEEQVTPMVYIDDNHQAHWAYKVSLFVNNVDNIPERPTAIVDAKTFKPFVQWNDIKTARKPAQAMGFGGNHKVGEFSYGKNLPLLEITRDKKLEKCFMETKDVRVVDLHHKRTSETKPMQFSCVANDKDPQNVFWTGYEGDGYDKENGAFSPTNDALYAGYVIKHMYADWYDAEVLTKKDGSPMQLVMRVHYGSGYENAYWDGRSMTFGDGEDMMYPLVSLGVGAHEISHGFTEQNAGLEYYGQSGGMNEAFSDMAAQAAEFYSLGQSSWMIGSEIMKEDSGYDALRFMDLPSKDGGSIDSADQYYSGLDVHYSSGVYNRLYYLMANQPGWDARKAFDVMVKANMDYWTPYTTFAEGACGVLSAAKDLNYPTDGIKDALTTVAIKYQSCR